MADVPTWSAPLYNVRQAPQLARTVSIDEEMSGLTSNFARNARWSPDGSVALAQCEDASFRLFDLSPKSIPDAVSEGLSTNMNVRFPQSSPVLDFCWFPFASRSDPASYCFLASVRECPVKLLDAVDGRLRASYKIVDHRERQIAPHSLAFNVTGTKIYCGFEDAIEVFDVQYPGEGSRWRTTPSKKSRDGLKGIISSLAFSSDPSSGVFAAGSLSSSAPSSSNIALFTEITGETPVMFVGNESAGTGLGIRSSVSQVMFNPSRPYILYASFRRHDFIYAWDLRGDVSNPFHRFRRHTNALSAGETMDLQSYSRNDDETNQRLRFDVDVGGNWMAIGNQSGHISMYDLNGSGSESPSVQDEFRSVPCLDASLTFAAHQDAIGSVAFHPSQSQLLSVSGSRHFEGMSSRDRINADSNSSDSGSEDDLEHGASEPVTLITRSRAKPAPLTRDNSIKLWSFDASQ